MSRWLRAKRQAAAARITLDIAEDVARTVEALDGLWWKLPPGDLANQVAELQNQLTDLYEREIETTKEHR